MFNRLDRRVIDIEFRFNERGESVGVEDSRIIKNTFQINVIMDAIDEWGN